MKRTILPLAAAILLLASEASAFCGFFVAKAGSELFNESSQVILVRDGDRTSITMSNDFKGDVKDFAMVVPVPVLLKEQDIKVVEQGLFNQLDAYSAPRLAEYYDQNPCYQPKRRFRSFNRAKTTSDAFATTAPVMEQSGRYRGVTIEAKYAVGEYDILLLSATQSNGLKNWLTDNEYTIPEDAHEVLDPYINSGMKFFVAKVNMEKFQNSGFQLLSPLQLNFESPKFMLPIRLGMANAQKEQDLVVYAFTRSGRVECSNYRTVKIPTNNDIPEFVQPKFGEFYKAIFDRCYSRENKNAVFLEYAWDLSTNNPVKCDPCVSPPPPVLAMHKSGVWWANQPNEKIFFTRLHVRYDREHFPQDLQFQVTPNNERFQGRYVMNHPASGNLDCENAQQYVASVVTRRERELREMNRLTGWPIAPHHEYIAKYTRMLDGNPMPANTNNSSTMNFDTGSLPPEEATTDRDYLSAPENSKAGWGNYGARAWLYVLLAASAVLLYMDVLRRLYRWRNPEKAS